MNDDHFHSSAREFAVDVSKLINSVFSDSIIPIAKEIGIVSNATKLTELVDELSQDAVLRFKDVPRVLAVSLLMDLIRGARSCLECVFEGGDAVFDSLEDLQASFFDDVREFFGYAKALIAVREQHRLGVSKKGGAAKKDKGDEMREKIRQAALSIKQKWSKERASLTIADAVQREPGTVKRHLNELFPGASWNQRHDSEK